MDVNVVRLWFVVIKWFAMDGVARTIGGLPSGTDPLVGLVDEAIAGLGLRADAWRRTGSGDRWITLAHHQARIPEQGWKLHVSATVPGALTTLKAVLPVLLGRPTTFKVAASLGALTVLNSGTGALSQVGKFITVYPSDDADAVDLARQLDQATAGLVGPVVPSDRRLREGGAVYYRYGAFGSQLTQSKNGEVAFAVRAPDGTLHPDLRGIGQMPPSLGGRPVPGIRRVRGVSAASPLVAGRYLVAGALHRSARGGVYLAADLETGQRLVLKRAQAYALMLGPGEDARDRLRHEAGVLRRLAGDERIRCPRVHALVEQGDDIYLVMDDVDARPLERAVRAWTVTGRLVPRHRVVALGRALARMLDAIHEQGLVYRDLKSTNVLVRADGEPWLIDFEHACEAGVPSRRRHPRVHVAAAGGGWASARHRRCLRPRRSAALSRDRGRALPGASTGPAAGPAAGVAQSRPRSGSGPGDLQVPGPRPGLTVPAGPGRGLGAGGDASRVARPCVPAAGTTLHLALGPVRPTTAS